MVDIFNAVLVLRAWLAFFRPIIHWFLLEMKKHRQQVKLAPAITSQLRAKHVLRVLGSSLMIR
jgi:hypothetical protein